MPTLMSKSLGSVQEAPSSKSNRAQVASCTVASALLACQLSFASAIDPTWNSTSLLAKRVGLFVEAPATNKVVNPVWYTCTSVTRMGDGSCTTTTTSSPSATAASSLTAHSWPRGVPRLSNRRVPGSSAGSSAINFPCRGVNIPPLEEVAETTFIPESTAAHSFTASSPSFTVPSWDTGNLSRKKLTAPASSRSGHALVVAVSSSVSARTRAHLLRVLCTSIAAHRA
mmetsp:Transcript_25599/g.56333  ORF Transcript_25599/g.56333 Transcript_25599/m.56333 type:complete len:227 (-) Transcript_25599:418-1098(-)